MNLPDLGLIYKVITWHESQREHGVGKEVGIFIPLPSDLAVQYPDEGREGEDSSPPHITLLYCGDIPPNFEEKLLETCQKVCACAKPFTVKIKKPKKFTNAEGQTIVHSPIKSNKLYKLHEKLKKEFLLNQIPVSHKFPEYKPHITIEYVNPSEKPKYSNSPPSGEWMVDSIWVWGMTSPQMIYLGK
jgi:2'-5' RNA ligase